MVPGAQELVDLYGVYVERVALRAKTRHPYFAPWWARFLQELQATLDRPPYPDLVPPSSSWRTDPDDQARHARLQAAGQEAEALAFAFALTDEPRWAERAGEIIRRISADDAPWAAPVHRHIYPELRADLGHATLCYRLAAALGWLGEALRAEVRDDALATLAAQGAVIHEDAGRGAWWADAPNSNWTSHLMHGLGAAGLALLGHDAALARPWIAMARDRMVEMLDLAGEEGAGVEGISYYMGCYDSILRFGTELRQVTGEDLCGHPFWSKASLFPLYHTLPDLSGRTPIGDSHYPGLSGSPLLCGIARVARDGVAQWQAHRAMERSDRRSIYDLIYYDPSVRETPPDDLPTRRVFHSVQIASLRSGWDSDAVYLHIHGGSNAWSHCHLDLAGFTLDAYGERLAIDHGSWGYSPHYFHVIEPQVSTAWHNTLVVDGADQRQAPRYRMSYDPTEGGDCYALLDRHLSCRGIEMLRLDATSAYGDQLERFWREVVYLPPDRFITYDSVRTNGARVQRHLQWLLHSEAPMSDLGERIEVRGQSATLVVEPVFPVGWRCRFPDRLGRAPATGEERIREAHCLSLYPKWVHIWNESPRHASYPTWDARGGQRMYGPDYSFLVVLTPIRAGSSAEWQVRRLAGDGVEGVEVAQGDRVEVVLFRQRGGPYVVGEVSSDADRVVVRLEGGRVTSAAMVRGTYLTYRGEPILVADRPGDRTLDT